MPIHYTLRNYYHGGSAFGSHPTLSNNLIAYWDLNETSGTRADKLLTYDLADNNTVGYVTGIEGNAATFVRTVPEWLSKTSGVSLGGASKSYTLSAWFRQTKVNNYYVYVSIGTTTWGNGTVLAFYTYSSAPGTVYAISGNGSAYVIAQGDTYADTPSWNHVVTWFDHTVNQVKYEVNGGSTYASPVLSGTLTTANSIWFGKEKDPGASYPTTGDLDAVGLWDRVLTSDERDDLYAAGSGLFY